MVVLTGRSIMRNSVVWAGVWVSLMDYRGISDSRKDKGFPHCCPCYGGLCVWQVCTCLQEGSALPRDFLLWAVRASSAAESSTPQQHRFLAHFISYGCDSTVHLYCSTVQCCLALSTVCTSYIHVKWCVSAIPTSCIHHAIGSDSTSHLLQYSTLPCCLALYACLSMLWGVFMLGLLCVCLLSNAGVV